MTEPTQPTDPLIPEPQEFPNPPAPDVIAPPVDDIPSEGPADIDMAASEAAPEVGAGSVVEPMAPPVPPPAPAPSPAMAAPVAAASAPTQWPASPEYASAPIPAPAPPAGPQTSSHAIIALILAVCSFLICPVIPAIVALVLANTAAKEIAASRGQVQGDGLVTATRIISWINIGLYAAAAIIGLFAIVVWAIAASAS